MMHIKYISLFVPNFRIFHCFMKEYALKNYEVIMGELQELYNKNPAPELVEIIDIYKMESTINYEKLLTNFPIVYDKLRDE